MFTHIFIYRLKTLMRDREMEFWTMAFPLILATLFHVVFANLSGGIQFSPIPVAAVQDNAYASSPGLRYALQAASTGETPLLTIETTTREDAETLLADGEIQGFVTTEAPGNPVLHVNKTGLPQSILRVFLNQYSRVNAAAEAIMAERPDAGPEIIARLEQEPQYLAEVPAGKAMPDPVLIIYFALFAMSAMYGAYFGLNESISIQADLSAQGARVNVAPVHKLKAFLSGTAASLVLHFSAMLLLLGYVRIVLGITFGDEGGLIVLAVFIASLTGLALGSFVGTCIRGTEDTKIGTLTAVIMTGSFLAGLMYPAIKYQVAQSVPLLTWINPVHLAADALYSLYYYTDYARFTANIAALAGLALVFWAGTYISIRRRKYASI